MVWYEADYVIIEGTGDDYLLCELGHVNDVRGVVMGAGECVPIDDSSSDYALVKVKWYVMKPITQSSWAQASASQSMTAPVTPVVKLLERAAELYSQVGLTTV